MDPWGTPLQFTPQLEYVSWFEILELIITHWYLPVKYECIKEYMEPLIP
jgi:hypothetical protein